MSETDRAAEHGEAGSGVHALLHRIVPAWLVEFLLVGAIYGVYELARGIHDGTQATANTVGRTLLRWEHTVHLDPERWLTIHLNNMTWLAVPASYFYASFHYIVTPIILVWLFNRHRGHYYWGRTWLAISTMVSLLIFYLVPTTPPRLLPGSDIPDVLKDVSSYGWWSGDGSAPRGLGGLTNQYAAMPSMHVGWALWCGIMLWVCAPYLWLRILGLLYPVVTAVVVMSTGNHYLLDTVAGVATMGAGAALTWAAYRALDAVRGRRRDGFGPPPDLETLDDQNSLHSTSG